ncbi:MAG TPA: GNAT family N-acetyltransferase [Dongiaceae bacterium]|nr:GNAT family N-acetyltransferase [Dongiaceae bacterium]
MIIATNRLRLRSMEPKDIDNFMRDLCDWEVQQWLTLPPFPYERKDGETFMAIVRANHATAHPTMFVIADKGTDEALGTVSVDIDGEGRGELGYWLGRAHWGRGIMKEAVIALLRHVSGHPSLRRLVAVTDPANVRSQRILSACGLAGRGLTGRPKPSRRGAAQVLQFELPIER